MGYQRISAQVAYMHKTVGHRGCAYKRRPLYYDQNAHDLSTLKEGDVVRMKPFVKGHQTWKKATVVRQLSRRSYLVKTSDGATYRRNRVHLNKTNEQPDDDYSDIPHAEEPESATTEIDAHPKSVAKTPSPNRTKSGRNVRRPSYLKDYDTK